MWAGWVVAKRVMFGFVIALAGALPSIRPAGTSWRLTLDVGRIPGTSTWMPDDWGASGARIGISGVEVELLDERCPGVGEARLGEAEEMYRLRVVTPGKFVGADGEVEVPAAPDGAWSQTTTSRSGEYRLRFFVDFPDGAARRDVELPAGRIFFTTACYIDAELELAQMASVHACRHACIHMHAGIYMRARRSQRRPHIHIHVHMHMHIHI